MKSSGQKQETFRKLFLLPGHFYSVSNLKPEFKTYNSYGPEITGLPIKCFFVNAFESCKRGNIRGWCVATPNVIHPVMLSFQQYSILCMFYYFLTLFSPSYSSIVPQKTISEAFDSSVVKLCLFFHFVLVFIRGRRGRRDNRVNLRTL